MDGRIPRPDGFHARNHRSVCAATGSTISRVGQVDHRKERIVLFGGGRAVRSDGCTLRTARTLCATPADSVSNLDDGIRSAISTMASVGSSLT